VPTGSVIFLDGTTPLGNGTLSSGAATLMTSSLAVGTHSITTIYSDDTNFTASTSGILAESVLDFTVTPSAPGNGSSSGSGGGASQTVAPGGTVTFTPNIAPTTGASFQLVTTLPLTGMPPGATGTVSPSTWEEMGSTSWAFPANIVLTPVSLAIQLPQVTAALERKNPPNSALPGILLGVLLLPFTGRIRKACKRLGGVLSVLLLMAVGVAPISGLGSCGASSGSGFFGQQQQTYTVTETVTSGALSHSSTFTLTIE